MSAPQIKLVELLASPQPHIDLRHPEFAATTQLFVTAIDSYVSHAKEEIARRKDEHNKHLKAQHDTKARVESETSEAKAREMELSECE